MVSRFAVGLLFFVGCWASLAQTPQELATAAGRALQGKDYATAEATYAKLLDLLPDSAEMHSNFGMACYYQRKFDCAERAFTRAIELKPGLFLPHWLLAQLLFERGDYQRALPHAERAHAHGLVQREVRNLLAGILVGLERHDRAVRLYKEALQADPSDADTYYRLGKVYLERGQRVMSALREHEGLNFAQLLAAERSTPDEERQSDDSEAATEAQRILAINAYKDALSSGVKVRGARVEYAKLEIAAGNIDAARDALEAELEEDPLSYEAEFQMARLDLLAADPLGAADRLDRAAVTRPEGFDPLPRLRVPFSDSGIAQRVPSLAARASDGSFAAALLLYRFFESEAGREADRWEEAALVARQRLQEGVRAAPAALDGLALLRRKRYEDGIRALLAGPEAKSLPPGGDVELARALYRVGRYDALVLLFQGQSTAEPELTYLVGSGLAKLGFDALESMVQVDPDSARAHQLLGEACFAQERYIEAASAFEEAAEREPRSPEIRFLLGNSYYKHMLFPAAAAAFRRTTELDDRHAEAHLMLGDALLQSGDSGGAVAALERSLELDGGLDEAYVLLGKAHRAQGNVKLALENLERGASVDKDGSIHYQLFMLYRTDRQPEKARAALEKSQQLRESARK